MSITAASQRLGKTAAMLDAISAAEVAGMTTAVFTRAGLMSGPAWSNTVRPPEHAHGSLGPHTHDEHGRAVRS